jgi:CRISPR-associated endonuclease Cas2
LLFFICYDVRDDDGPERQQAIDDFLAAAGASRVLYSAWLLGSTLPVNDVFDQITTVFGPNDGITVAEITNQTVTHNVMMPVSEVERLLTQARG